MSVLLGKIEKQVQETLNKAFISCPCNKKVLKTKVWLLIIGVALCLGLSL